MSLLIALTLLALGIRAAYVATAVVDNPIRADAAQYVRYGYNLAFHGVYSSAQAPDVLEPDSFRSPGYPLQLAALLALVDNPAAFYRTQLVIQAFLSALVVPIVILLARRTMRESYALAVGLMTALMPHQVTSSGYLLTETLQSFLFAASILGFVTSLARHRISTSVLAGILFGLLYMTNEATLLLAPLLVALVLLGSHTARHPRSRRGLIVLLGSFAVFPVAWQLRGIVSIPAESKNLGSGRAWSAAVEGSYPGFRFGEHSTYGYAYRADSEFRDMQTSAHRFFEVMRSRVADDPTRYLAWYSFQKPLALWKWGFVQGAGDIYIYGVDKSIYESQGWARLTRELIRSLHPFALCLAAFAIIHAAFGIYRKGLASDLIVPAVLSVTIVYWTAVHTVLLALPRYGIALRPEVYLLAAWALVESAPWPRRIIALLRQ